MSSVKKCFALFTALLLLLAGGCEDPLGLSDGSDSINWEEDSPIPPVRMPDLSEEEKAAYRMDAEKLAVRRVHKLDSTQTEIPERLMDNLYNGLLRITSSDEPHAKEVTQYNISALRPAHPREIIVHADSSADWMDAWRNGQSETGEPTLDSLIHRFNFELTEFREIKHVLKETMATLRSDRPINGYAVGRLFEEHRDVKWAAPDGVLGPTDITVQYFETHLRYTFSYGWGDCPAGCINEHRWHFTVNSNGTVDFDGEEGAPLPDG